MKEKTPLSHEGVCFQMLDFETSTSKSQENSWKITSFSKTTSLPEGAVSHNVVNYQPLPKTRYQVRFMPIIIISRELPTVSTAFNPNNLVYLWRTQLPRHRGIVYYQGVYQTHDKKVRTVTMFPVFQEASLNETGYQFYKRSTVNRLIQYQAKIKSK